MSVNGIDVSSYEPNVNWSQAKASGIQFAFIKATEGVTLVDDSFSSHWTMSIFAGLIRGAYHFYHPKDDPIDQANLLTTTVGELAPADLPFVMDFETLDNADPSQILANAKIFLQKVENVSGKTPIIYGSPSFLNALRFDSSFSRYPLWIANYQVIKPSIPPPWRDYVFWQTSESANVTGVGTCDFNIFNGDQADLINFAKQISN
jgi:lysozyme